MRIFRYFNTRWGIATLKDRRLKSSDPTKFNDPFELSPTFDLSKYDKSFVRKLAQKDYIIQVSWKNLIPNIYPSYELYKEHWMKNLDAEVERRFPPFHQNIIDTKRRFLQDYSNSWRIISFSRSIDSILLWSHYGDSHKGVALEFDTTDEYLQDVSDEYILDVTYSSKKAEFEPWDDFKGFSRELIKATKWKSLEWSYEQEVRILLARPAMRNDFFPFQGAPVRGVYFGINCPDSEVARCCSILKHSDYSKTRIYKGLADENEYKIRFEEIGI